MKPFIPIWNTDGNKLIRYEEKQFNDGAGNTGQLTVAIFKDKKGKVKETDAWIKWNT